MSSANEQFDTDESNFKDAVRQSLEPRGLVDEIISQLNSRPSELINHAMRQIGKVVPIPRNQPGGGDQGILLLPLLEVIGTAKKFSGGSADKDIVPLPVRAPLSDLLSPHPNAERGDAPPSANQHRRDSFKEFFRKYLEPNAPAVVNPLDSSFSQPIDKDSVRQDYKAGGYRRLQLDKEESTIDLPTGDKLQIDGGTMVLVMPGGDKVALVGGGHELTVSKGATIFTDRDGGTSITYPNGDSVSLANDRIRSIRRNDQFVVFDERDPVSAFVKQVTPKGKK